MSYIVKIENLRPISEAAPVDLDPDCRTPVSGGICDLLLYFRRVLNGIVLLFYVLTYKNFLRKHVSLNVVLVRWVFVFTNAHNHNL